MREAANSSVHAFSGTRHAETLQVAMNKQMQEQQATLSSIEACKALRLNDIAVLAQTYIWSVVSAARFLLLSLLLPTHTAGCHLKRERGLGWLTKKDRRGSGKMLQQAV